MSEQRDEAPARMTTNRQSRMVKRKLVSTGRILSSTSFGEPHKVKRSESLFHVVSRAQRKLEFLRNSRSARTIVCFPLVQEIEALCVRQKHSQNTHSQHRNMTED